MECVAKVANVVLGLLRGANFTLQLLLGGVSLESGGSFVFVEAGALYE